MKKVQLLKEHKTLSALFLISWAFLLSFLLECLNRHSIVSTLGFLVNKPMVFVYNVLIVLLTLSISLLFKKKTFYLGLTTFVWTVLGSVNFVIRSFRKTPLTADDFRMITHLRSILSFYLKPYQMILLVGLVAVAVGALLYSWLKTPKHRRQLKHGFLIGVASALTLFGLPQVSLSIQAFSQTDGNLGKTYNEFGFAYSFMGSVMTKGISQPETYSEETMKALLAQLQRSSHPTEDANIIFVQLESFFNIHRLQGVNYSEDPIPNFMKYLKQYSSGLLKVPSLGGGTANTEFEVLTGMNLEFFGIGEYPYKTVLSQNTTETMAFVLKELGYHTTAIHNNNANFYSRHKVYKNLGFDVFDALETMTNVSYTPIGWAKDDVLVDRIQLALNQNTHKDFVYAIAVSSHGDYPSDIDEAYKKFFASGNIDSINPESFAYFLTLLNEVDDVVEELVQLVHAQKEPTMMVIFGDHLPGFNFTEFSTGDEYTTEYFIVDNMNLPKVDQDLTSYQLGSHVFSLLNLEGGLFTQLHKRFADSSTYLEKQHLLQYDMLYGDGYLYGYSPLYQPVDIQYGILPMRLEEIFVSESFILVKGQNFTEFHQVVINGKHIETSLLSDTLLMVEFDEVAGWLDVAVALVSENNETIQITPSKIVKNSLAR